ncbi:MAG: YgiQ family radical SAM protein [Bacteroidales bacterium]|nr:YgiQ family radical SAM protein [Bacteroidales bacterium]
MNIIPVTIEEAKKLGWDIIDVIIFTGDAYIDHPSFGVAIIARIIESCGLKVAIVPQPNWRDDLRDFKKFGKPRFFFGVTSGNVDSMVNHYTSFKRLRNDDAYTPGNVHGFRPNYAVNVYCNILKKLYPDVPIVIGGIEASLRRFVHYDYWSNKVMPSVLFTSKADLLIYGMAEKPLKILLQRLIANNDFFTASKNLPQSAVLSEKITVDKYIKIPSYEECLSNKYQFAKAFVEIEKNYSKYTPDIIIQPHFEKYLIVHPPVRYNQAELDEIYSLPFTYEPHPKYKKKKSIPAYEAVKNSITIHRGCFGGCSFCALTVHQGKFVVSRSLNSILREVEILITKRNSNVHITDLGGPSANMYMMSPINIEKCNICSRPSCIFPAICSNLNTSVKPLLDLYNVVKNTKGVKKLTIGSGIRYDINLMLLEKDVKNKIYLQNVIKYHTSGWFKVAPEHTENNVLKLMRKPSFDYYVKLLEIFNNICKNNKLNNRIMPYFISGHPGCKMQDMKNLRKKLIDLNIKPELVQDYTPTPMTLSSVMYYTKMNPYTFENIYVPSTIEEKRKQKEFFFWYDNFKRKNN